MNIIIILLKNDFFGFWIVDFAALRPPGTPFSSRGTAPAGPGLAPPLLCMSHCVLITRLISAHARTRLIQTQMAVKIDRLYCGECNLNFIQLNNSIIRNFLIRLLYKYSY